MSANELRKQVNEMKDAFNCVVQAATEPVQKSIDSKFNELQLSVDKKLENFANNFCFKNEFIVQLEENNVAINDMKIAFDSLSKGNSEGPAIALLNSLSGAFDKCHWEETQK